LRPPPRDRSPHRLLTAVRSSVPHRRHSQSSMPKYAVQPQWRQRRAAIGKKNAFEVEMLDESELVVDTYQPVKPTVNLPSSPISVAASALDLSGMPEMVLLPGAWTVVGKGGRPMKAKMYDEPEQKAAKKKKKKKKRPHTSPDEDPDEDSSLADIAEAPSSSKCVHRLDCMMQQRYKEVAKGKNVTYWVNYQRVKHLKAVARDALLAEFASNGMLVDETEEEALAKICAPDHLTRRNNKADSHGEKIRRQRRKASAAARCFSHEASGDEMPTEQSCDKPTPPVSEGAKAPVASKMPGKMPKEMAEADPSTSPRRDRGWSEVTRKAKQCIIA